MVGVALIPSTALASSAQHLGDRTLREGATGQDVSQLQTDLTTAGFKTPAVGNFGPQTFANVKRFQKSVKLAASGVVGAQTVAALQRAAGDDTTTPTTTGGTTTGGTTTGGTTTGGTTTRSTTGGTQHLGDRTLTKGAHGHDVRVLQDYLTRSGYVTDIDGAFGAGTLKNVKAFQRANNLPTTGIDDDETTFALRRLVEGGAASDSVPGLTTPGPTGSADKATLNSDGTATAPADAPQVVKNIIAAGNKIANKPYIYGGGHGTWNDAGYDCSGSVSYALHGGGLLNTQLDSTGLESFGSAGKGNWVTIWANAGHTYMEVAGLRFDTSGADPSRWQTDERTGSGYVVRHPKGL